MPKPKRAQYPTADKILDSLTDLINKVEEINFNESDSFVHDTANKMIAELKNKQEVLREYVLTKPQYDPYHSYQVLSEILAIVKEHKTNLEAAPGFWNKVAYHLNQFFGAEVFTVNKTDFSKGNDEKAASFNSYKEELKDMKDNATFDSVSKTFSF
ncbi:hypothetical protein [Legionella sp. km772]|uniref:hypothetical protein n=1 Tax=Legionella sp. km772 TaxID=2498111 RepID=UPI000F8C961E|nr:hypothetical protein [Legionella sp. km772]RUR06743.1 hypothetical protein ELY15_12930 [Legionella sp. km772]